MIPSLLGFFCISSKWKKKRKKEKDFAVKDVLEVLYFTCVIIFKLWIWPAQQEIWLVCLHLKYYRRSLIGSLYIVVVSSVNLDAVLSLSYHSQPQQPIVGLCEFVGIENEDRTFLKVYYAALCSSSLKRCGWCIHQGRMNWRFLEIGLTHSHDISSNLKRINPWQSAWPSL